MSEQKNPREDMTERGPRPRPDDRLRALLREGDPAADGRGLARDESAALRRRVLAAIPERARAGRWLPAAAAVAALVVAALLVPRLIEERPPGPRDLEARGRWADPVNGAPGEQGNDAGAGPPAGEPAQGSRPDARGGDFAAGLAAPPTAARGGLAEAMATRGLPGPGGQTAGEEGAAAGRAPLTDATAGEPATLSETGPTASAVLAEAVEPEAAASGAARPAGTGDRRQIQFATTRGTRIIWVLDAGAAL